MINNFNHKSPEYCGSGTPNATLELSFRSFMVLAGPQCLLKRTHQSRVMSSSQNQYVLLLSSNLGFFPVMLIWESNCVMIQTDRLHPQSRAEVDGWWLFLTGRTLLTWNVQCTQRDLGSSSLTADWLMTFDTGNDPKKWGANLRDLTLSGRFCAESQTLCPVW